MENPTPRPDTINALRFGADASFAMLAGMQLEVFTPLQHGPMTTEQIADAIGVAPTRLPLLLYALVAAGLLTEQDGRFSNTPEAQHFLVKDAPAYMGQLQRVLTRRWGYLHKTGTSLRTGVPQAYIDFSSGSQQDIEGFLRLLNVGTVAVTQELVARYDFSSITTLADVGGGAGGLAITLTQACPHVQATVIDLPLATSTTQKVVEESGATERVSVLTADVVSGPVPGAYDVAIARELIQVLSPEDARQAIKNIGMAINPGGRLYIVGQILDDSRSTPPPAVGFNLIFLNTFYVGESYTEREHREWLREAGFVDIERANFLLNDSLSSGVMTARKRG